MCRVQLQDGDRFLLLACDGVWDVLTNQEARSPPLSHVSSMSRVALLHLRRVPGLSSLLTEMLNGNNPKAGPR